MKNNILPNQFINHPVVVIEEVDSVIEQCTGSNQKKLLVVYNISKTKDENIEFLKKILSAANFDSNNDILLLGTTDKKGFSYSTMRTKVAIDNLLVFGFSPQFFGLNLEIPLYHPLQFQDSGFLFGDDLSIIEQKKELKGALWLGMKELFKI